MVKLSLKESLAKWASWFAFGGLLMPLGILGEVYLKTSPVFVLLGGLSMFLSAVVLGIAVVQMNRAKES